MKVKVYHGFFVLSDGRKSSTWCNRSKLDLKNFLRGRVVDALVVTGGALAECFIFSSNGFVLDHYVLDRKGRKHSDSDLFGCVEYFRK